ncbi:MAG TPA: hypothetical protein PLY87_31575, partial [Planctomycetaceae bacterium]|nr:hypothetical protein [Planctomycetaceae bacterium]
MRHILASLALLTILNSSTGWSQDTADDLARLQQQNELLEAKLEAANFKIEKLEDELAGSCLGTRCSGGRSLQCVAFQGWSPGTR